MIHLELMELIIEAIETCKRPEELKVFLNARNVEVYGNEQYVWDYCKRVLSQHRDVIDSMSFTRDTTSYGMMGRLWKTKGIVSFWNQRKTVLRHWNTVEPTLRHIFGNVQNLQFDFVEKDTDEPLYRTQDLNTPKKELPMDKIKKLLARQHFDSKAKAQLKALGIIGGAGSEKYADVASQAGFPHTAAYHASTPVQENTTIKLKDLLKNS